jgi:hypothetical protein
MKRMFPPNSITSVDPISSPFQLCKVHYIFSAGACAARDRIALGTIAVGLKFPGLNGIRAAEVKRKGENAIKSWIDENMKYKSCVVVLIGSETANRPRVTYEIVKGWNDGKAVLGIHIHNIKCANMVRLGQNGICTMGPNPFDRITFNGDGRKLSSVVQCYNPSQLNAYGDIAGNIDRWIEEAIRIRAAN